MGAAFLGPPLPRALRPSPPASSVRILPPTLVASLLAACSSPVESPATAADPLAPIAPLAPPAPVADAPLAAELAADLERGRAELAAGRASEAEAIFQRVSAADGGSLRTQMWVLRAWMEQGRGNDTLDALDALNHAGVKGPDLDYLYGMAFARRAEGLVADGVSDSSIEMNFIDATGLLKQAVELDANRYRDAWLPLARAAWFTQELETARWASQEAVQRMPEDGEAWLARARIAMSEFVNAEGSEPGGAEAEAALARALESFQKGLELLGPAEGERAAKVARAATELGNAYLWRQRGAEASAAYARAIAAAPASFDYGQAFQLLAGAPRDPERPSGFRPTLELARESLASAGRLQGPEAGVLLWWLGWARFNDGAWVESEQAFQEGLALAPEYTNAWFYIGLARHYAKDSSGAVTAMRTGWAADPTSMVSTVASAGGSQRAFESLLAWCAAQEPPRNLDAAFLAEMLTEAQPEEPRHWNNLGLFLRDEGERVEYAAFKKEGPEPDAAWLADLYQRSYRAYQKALELTPDDPQVINDTALMLHYHLDGDLAEVEATYRRALARLDELLAQSDLSEEDRARFEQTKSDIGVNLKALLEPEAEADTSATPAAAPGAATAPSGGEGQ